MTKTAIRFLLCAAGAAALQFAAPDASAQNKYTPPTKFSRQFVIDKSRQSFANNEDLPKELKQNARQRRMRDKHRKADQTQDDRTASQEKLSEDKPKRRKKQSRARQRAASKNAVNESSGGLND
jgi:hypothetical protein